MNSNTIKFNGEDYYDDRLFVLYLCPGNIEIEEGEDEAVWTTIYHENPPEDHVWCVVTYKNSGRYPLYRIDSFYRKEDALEYIKNIEPQTPLISKNGNPPENILAYEDYTQWKVSNNYKDYNWKTLYSVDGTNQKEVIGQTKDQFKGIN